MSDFIQLRLSGEVWLSACGKCREVVAFARTAEALHDAESEHECSPEDEELARSIDAA